MAPIPHIHPSTPSKTGALRRVGRGALVVPLPDAPRDADHHPQRACSSSLARPAPDGRTPAHERQANARTLGDVRRALVGRAPTAKRVGDDALTATRGINININIDINIDIDINMNININININIDIDIDANVNININIRPLILISLSVLIPNALFSLFFFCAHRLFHRGASLGGIASDPLRVGNGGTRYVIP